MVLSPIGVASLIIEAIFSVENLSQSIKMISIHSLITTLLILFYATFALSAIYWTFTRKNPFSKYSYFFETSLLGFATSSGYACMSKAIECCEKKLDIDPRIAKFCIPFYTTLESASSCIFILMSCVFLAKLDGHELNVHSYIVIFLLSILLSLSMPAVPYASNFLILIILKVVGVGEPNIAVLFPLEWFMDRL